ncbi:glycosyltransferase [Pedobacter sp. PLR]|uniref:glycosyltransferase n=1 Tax=Pedobacter sp. PLR TaxID=2994465 RepID=UPI0022474819|nr:glycosyltransferase [Pedobacter sp. PLR]MCX2453370.1 glycosyltransferase [Pedobacter sp. PLR]
MEPIDYTILFNEGEALEADLILELGDISIIPDVSIMIPTYNRPKLLFEALNSALTQDYKGNYEIVIIDNCSDKESFLLVIQNLKLLTVPQNCKIRFYKCISHSNGWNMGIIKAEANFIVMLHDDDLLNSNHLTVTSRLAKMNKDIDILCSDSQVLMETDVLSKANKLYAWLKERIKEVRRGRLIKLKIVDFYFENPAPNTGIFFKRDLVLRHGGFNSKYNPIPDYAFLYQFLKDGRTIFYLNQKLSSIRFSVNDGLKRDTNLRVKVKIELIRKDIRGSNFFLRSFDLGYHTCNNLLTVLELKNKKSGFDNFQIFALRMYTRILSLVDSSFRIWF